MKKLNLLILTTILIITGCTNTVHYKPELLSEKLSTLSARFDGKALIFTEEKEDLKEYSQNPSSLTGSVTTLKTNVGIHLREISKEVFSRLFEDGADHSNSLKSTDKYTIIIKPEVLNYDYRYNQLKNLGFAITPETKIDLYVTFKDKEGNDLLSKKYSSDYLTGGTYLASVQPHERVNKSIHESIFNLLVQVSNDILSLVN